MPVTADSTLADLAAEKRDLTVTCRGCGRLNTLTPHRLAGVTWMPGEPPAVLAGITIAQALARMRCTRCGAREVDWTAPRRIY